MVTLEPGVLPIVINSHQLIVQLSLQVSNSFGIYTIRFMLRRGTPLGIIEYNRLYINVKLSLFDLSLRCILAQLCS